MQPNNAKSALSSATECLETTVKKPAEDQDNEEDELSGNEENEADVVMRTEIVVAIKDSA